MSTAARPRGDPGPAHRPGTRPLPSRVLRILALLLSALAIVAVLRWLAAERIEEPPLSAAQWTGAGYGPRNYDEAIERAGEDVQLGRERVSRGPGEWLRLEVLADALMERSRIAYTYDDLAEAGAVLDEAKRFAPARAGPMLTDAIYGQMIHRLDRSEAALDGVDGWAVRSDTGVLGEAAGLRGDIAFFRGDLGGARRAYGEAAAYDDGGTLAFRRARLAKAEGDFDEAIRQFARSVPDRARASPLVNAYAALQIGAVELARGNRAAAKEWFLAADRQFPGYWLIEAHLAQAKALDGDLPGAIADMEAIARRAPAAEVLDALAMLLRANGEAARSREWAARADAIWRQRIARLPSAAYGHALEHELVFGTPGRALELARRNLAAHPYGEARILMASAWLMNGRTDEALAELAKAERSGWRSAPLYALRAQALELSGQPGAAAEARADAEALNPRIFAPETALVWFSHG